ncbi:unnamed protein product [Penicillium salamii]|uniref:Uncharacterized protein n=1 Tax=Penicillium salamii TaxID=1612424 RepID=A0A9W4IF97_9EURO|nr:unnamed protein product [Penicillium salamii]CAG7967487.1 unnamed protein product [Penicillium salamii]CAG7988970.1 unnamed protein product [Penicillium salamii]CAG8132211.1 unnamed protein product [Penicillium salamii]CAG8193496.1 unnamed protein product [Penicillium salamii]
MAPFDLDGREKEIFSRVKGPGLWVGLVTASGLPAGTAYTNVKARSLTVIRKLVKQVGQHAWGQPKMVAFESHAPFKIGFTAEAIGQNYWTKLYALQGHRNTWYTGIQFLPGSSQLWNYTSTLIPDIVA